MRVLALDISTSTGWCLMEGEKGTIPKILDTGSIVNPKTIKAMGDYPWNYLAAAELMTNQLADLVSRHQDGQTIIIIEEINMGKNRFSQKALDFLHCMLLYKLKILDLNKNVFYVNSADWRKTLGIHMTKVDKAQNIKVKRLKRINTAESKATLKEAGLRGKITKKHLAIRWVNEAYGLELRPKDDDIADAICQGSSWYMGVGFCDGTNQKRGAK